MIGKTRVCPNANPFFYGVSFAVNKVVGEAGVTTSYTVTDDDFTILVDATAVAVTVNLPDATTCKGRVYAIKKIDAVTANAVSITPFTGQKIDGSTSAVNLTAANATKVIQSDGTGWAVIAG